MEGFLWILFAFLVIQRLGELGLARSNRKWMLNRGAIESGENHYILFIILHSLFFVSLLLEFTLTSYQHTSSIFYVSLSMFIVLQVLRIWCISSLGRRWNTRILVLPDEQPLKKGPYQFIPHPNYVIVFLELLFIPLLFQAYITALVFPFLHLLVLKVRIPAEEKALEERA
ncbi:isoprenylcysteine carboxyl methyltransferase family protein [Halobacillus sp. K22]|uniref:isoprenylcysteine carboxyl methyltransferase family protein n=1 Tax=Halobacillus sp. K22 TaxID=3457431 RepID=UPI003FCC633C